MFAMKRFLPQLLLVFLLVLVAAGFFKSVYATHLGYPWHLNADPTYSCNSVTGEWTVRWTWSGPADTSVFLFIYKDSFPGPPADEPLVYEYQIPASQSASGSRTWVLPKANQQYVAMINAFGQASAGVAIIGTTTSCVPPPPPPPPPPAEKADLVIRNSSDGTSPVVNVTSPATISGSTITVPVNQAFNISFRTRNIGAGSSGTSSRTVAENFGAATGGYSQFTVGSLPPNTSSTVHSINTSYTLAGSKSILLRVDADGVVAESNEGANDANVTVNVTEPIVILPGVPVPNAPTGLPGCINAGSTYGPGVGLSWSAVPNFTSYKVRFTSGSRTSGDYATKTVTVNSTTGTGGWSTGGNPLVTWVSGTNLALQGGVTYFYAVSAQVATLDSGYDLVNKSVQIGPVGTCGPKAPSDLQVFARCGTGGDVLVDFTFNDNSDDEQTIWLDVNSSAWTGAGSPSPWGVKTFNRTEVEKDYTGPVTWTWSAASSVTGGPPNAPIQNTTYWWRVIAGNGTGNSAHVYPPNTTTPPGLSFTTPTCAPADPYLLSAVPTCRNGNAEVLFKFIDDSVDEDQFVVEINDRPWNGSGVGPTPFGSKTLTRLPVQKTSRGGQVLYLWRLALPVDSGDTNSSTLGDQISPEQNKTYWWRVRARTSVGVASNNVYPGSGSVATLVPPGISVTTLLCQSDLKVSFDNDSWRDSLGNDPGPLKKFEPKEKVTVDVKVEKVSGFSSPTTDLYVYYKDLGVQMPDCGLSPARPATSPPVDSAGDEQKYIVPILTDALPTATISVSLSIDSVGGTVYAYVVPRCEFDSSPWGNNVASQTYIVETEGFLETQGGDVGAVGNISVAVKSSTLAPPIYQGNYVINAQTMDLNVDSKNNWIIKQYMGRQVPKGGLYEYFDVKFKGKAVEQTEGNCSFGGSDQFVNCKGNLTFNNSDSAPTASRVYFVEKDLRFKKNFELDSNTAVLFIVKGDVIVDLRESGPGNIINRVDGVFIVKGTFKDSDVADSGVATESDALTVNGAVFAENTTGALDLKRYFTTPINKTKPANKFIWDPKQFVKLSELVGTSSIVWKEVAP